MEGEKLYAFKPMCNELGMTCHNTKNRVIEKMCVCEKKQVIELAKYLKLSFLLSLITLMELFLILVYQLYVNH